jgi:zona occludens toxin (predicted ATPase)
MNQIIEPNFEGEEMKIPESARTDVTYDTEASGGVLSTPIIVVLVLVMVTIFAGLGYWYYLVVTAPIIDGPAPMRPTLEQNQEPETTTATARTESLDVVSTSDEIDAIEADVLSTNLEDLDAELSAIDNEFETALEAGM